MKTIYKYGFADEVAMPEGAQILDIQEQNGRAQIWALVDTEKPMITRKFLLIGTGQEVKNVDGQILEHIGTFRQLDGVFIWHVFERKEKL